MEKPTPFSFLTRPACVLTAFSTVVLIFWVTSLIRSSAISPWRRTIDFDDAPVQSLGVEEAFTSFQVSCSPAISPLGLRSLLTNRIYRSRDPFTDFPSPEISKLLASLPIKGWDSSATVFKRVIEETKPSLILELGTYLGASAIHMANVSASLGLSPLILCLDDFRGWIEEENQSKSSAQSPMVFGDSLQLYQFMSNVVRAGHQDTILPLPYNVETALRALCHLGVRADLIEVDAGHTFLSAWHDVNLAYPLLAQPGGVMFGHDIQNEEVRKAVKLFAMLHGLSVERDKKHWILRPGKRKRAHRKGKQAMATPLQGDP
eukprot:TRINITY_DN39358_c0_g1_i1.p1 TRINITY_DN39358_c0_g1~~TRINITY_DN39358_c0_g1_i1.p1  ORF type:complete len:318 (-),score=21.91 TRINITY_DN39358_c0_g1_i1:107-1060(-)